MQCTLYLKSSISVELLGTVWGHINCKVHYTLYTVQCTMYILRCTNTMYIVYSNMYIVYTCTMHIAHSCPVINITVKFTEQQ